MQFFIPSHATPPFVTNFAQYRRQINFGVSPLIQYPRSMKTYSPKFNVITPLEMGTPLEAEVTRIVLYKLVHSVL